MLQIVSMNIVFMTKRFKKAKKTSNTNSLDTKLLSMFSYLTFFRQFPGPNFFFLRDINRFIKSFLRKSLITFRFSCQVLRKLFEAMIHLPLMFIQSCIQNPVKHLRWSILQKQLTSERWKLN